MFVNPDVPNLPDFITYCQGQGVTPDALPADSDYYAWALTHGMDRTICSPAGYPPIEYVIAVYNYGLNWLLNWAPDQSGLALDSLAWSAGIVTASTASALATPVGQTLGVVVSGAVPVGYNVATTATVLGTNSFMYPLATNPGTETSPGVFGTTFFANARAQFKILTFIAGPVSSSGDQGTNQTLIVPEWLKTATLSTLNLLNTPYGRAYVDYSQMFGPSLVGLS